MQNPLLEAGLPLSYMVAVRRIDIRFSGPIPLCMSFLSRFTLIAGCCTLFFSGCSNVERPINRSNFQDRLPEVRVVVEIITTMGPIEVELYRNFAPITVDNFLQYARDDHYDGTVFHRVIDGFIVQGGGFTPEMVQKLTRDSILNEASNGLKNERGTIAMARTNDKDSASSQCYFNLKANTMLDHGVRNYGYAVFGRVISGMEIVDAISRVQVTVKNGMQDVPVDSISIIDVRELSREEIERGPVIRDRRL